MTRSTGCRHRGQGMPGAAILQHSRHTHRCMVAPCRNPASRGADRQMTHWVSSFELDA